MLKARPVALVSQGDLENSTSRSRVLCFNNIVVLPYFMLSPLYAFPYENGSHYPGIM